MAGGKDVLIKYVAQAIPVFLMACFILSRGLCEHISSLTRQLGHGQWYAPTYFLTCPARIGCHRVG
jgi:hypothetical protein